MALGFSEHKITTIQAHYHLLFSSQLAESKVSQELNKRRLGRQAGEAVPWAYAAVLINLHGPTITQLRNTWGEEFVFGRADLENTDRLLNCLKMTFPAQRIRSLSRDELNDVRATIYPVVEIELPNRSSFILDEVQEKIVAEAVRVEPLEPARKASKPETEVVQGQLFSNPPVIQSEKEVLPAVAKKISQNFSIRLVRGFSGSGKTLVLIQRAKLLAAQYPEWKIGVLTYNKPLQSLLENALKGTNIDVRTFHSLCRVLKKVPDAACCELDAWLEEYTFDFLVIRRLGKEFVGNEIDWLRDLGITSLDDYLSSERHGVGKEGRLSSDQRKEIFEVFSAYCTNLQEKNLWDWHKLPLDVLAGLENGTINPTPFDMILVDEAQDWAPVWFKVVNHLLHPEHGSIFLADDPSQSIYRFFSWREKGISVVGRTRWLRIPYRNTFEIYSAAYSLIANQADIQARLKEEGDLVEPDLSSQMMRHGPKPVIHRCINIQQEYEYIKNNVMDLKAKGMSPDTIAVLTHFRGDVIPIQKALQGTGVQVQPIHSFKGLEMDAIFLPHLQRTFQRPEDDAAERRLIYMAMSRARDQLYLTYFSRLPRPYEVLRAQNLCDFTG